MRKILIRLVLAAAALALLLGACYMLWPYSFLDLQPGCDSVTVFYIDTADDNFSQCVTKETYSADSAEFRQIMGVLSCYTYHRSFRTLQGANGMEGNHAGYWLQVYLDHGDDRAFFTCGGTREISINGLVWRVGYWGNRASLDMMAEIAAILGK